MLAKSKTKNKPKAGSGKKKDGFWETLKTVFWALLIAMAFRSALYQPFSIPSGSMKPTLLVGDYLFVSKFSYGYSHYSLPFAPRLFDGRIWAEMPERGDVAVFKHPARDECSQGPIGMVLGLVGALTGQGGGGPNDCVDYVKRVIGLPGDRIQVRAGVLHLNGEPVPTERDGFYVEPKRASGNPPSRPRCVNEPVPASGDCRKELWLEALPNGVTHPVLNITGTVGDTEGQRYSGPDNTPVFEVPQGQLFFMGDNRDNSIDSRFPEVGTVPVENLIGRAEIIALSAEGPFWQVWNWRFDRMFRLIE